MEKNVCPNCKFDRFSVMPNRSLRCKKCWSIITKDMLKKVSSKKGE